jgi:hypothetical protein
MASGYISLLEEPDDFLKIHALEQLNERMECHWAEFCPSLPTMFVIFSSLYYVVFILFYII